MVDSTKLWIIEDEEKPEIMSLGEELQATSGPPPAPRRPVVEPVAPQVTAAPRAAARPVARPTATRRPRYYQRWQFAMVLAAGYLLGPLSVLLTRRGRSSRAWLTAAVATVVAGCLLTLGWLGVARGDAPAWLPLLLAGSVIDLAAGFTVWAHGLHLLHTTQRYPTGPWPRWLRHPATASLLGLVAPGSALTLVRRSARAALTVWSGWPAAVAVLMLVQAPVLWRHREVFRPWGVSADGLEFLFLAAGIVGLIAPLAWVAQALDGGRLASLRPGQAGPGHADRTALALVVTLGVMVVAARPAHIAVGLDDFAAGLAERGCRVLPLGMTLAAQRLDPSQPSYALQAAELYALRGDEAAARQVRRDLDRDLAAYVGTLYQEGRMEALGGERPAGTPAVRPAASAAPEPVAAPVTATPEPAAQPGDVATAAALVFWPGSALGLPVSR